MQGAQAGEYSGSHRISNRGSRTGHTHAQADTMTARCSLTPRATGHGHLPALCLLPAGLGPVSQGPGGCKPLPRAGVRGCSVRLLWKGRRGCGGRVTSPCFESASSGPGTSSLHRSRGSLSAHPEPMAAQL